MVTGATIDYYKHDWEYLADYVSLRFKPTTSDLGSLNCDFTAGPCQPPLNWSSGVRSPLILTIIEGEII